jgi:hypothetical protein
MTLPSAENLAPLLALTLYIVLKDVVVPLMRRRNHRNGNPGHSNPGTLITGEVLAQVNDLAERVGRIETTDNARYTELRGDVRHLETQAAERWADQLRVNDRQDKNVSRIVERLDEGKRN